MASVSWLLLVGLAGAVCADSEPEPVVYFREQFEDGDGWQKRWIESKHKSDFGKFRLTSGKFFGDEEKDKGLQTSEDAKFYAISSRFEPFTNDGQTLVIQFTVKHEQNIDCGGGYVKLLPSSLKQEEMYGNSTYYIMFGPDICGTGNKKVHVIFNYKEKNHLINKDVRCKDDEYTHLYTLIVRPNNTYEVKIDNASIESGSLEEDWDFLPAKRIIDPNATKPEDWDEREQIDDPDDKRPEDWEEIEHIVDPDSKRPDDWDEEMDGEWEPPMISNPKYKGIWKPKRIDNPNFKGEWVQPEIDNPEYVPDPNIYRYENIGVIGLDLWQVKSGTIFDNFLITNDENLAENIAKETWGITTEAEKKMKESQEEEDKKNQEKDKESKVEKKANEMEEEVEEVVAEEEVEEVVAEEEEEEVAEDEEAREESEDEAEKHEEDEEETESQPKDEL